ncbi:hypothetical protein BOTBODRAFT_188882 [Botryobasidium botryosum FD-172 SS1]|uniref:F-box domain-containing protein n=1 Tax=Botryobasidium botryosum (strain FD-172 SS1) TaxID=930990 RepID=A0A067MBF2_BOTB1|nr:hypothetical protein BOTBODRAFT_188882 [Botryobasidium botryosum FD-172 SS1]
MATTLTIAPEILEAFLSSFRYQLPRGEGVHTASSTTPTRVDLDRELGGILRTPDAIAAHELARQIRSHLNRISLFHRLPTEVVSIIFHLAVHNDQLRQYEPAKLAIRISSVSQLWREIATQMCSTLWTKLDALPAPLLDLFLSRSGSAPLEIVFTTWTAPSTVSALHFFERIVPYIHRWRDCRIFYDVSKNRDVLSLLQEASAPAPQLEVLRLHFVAMHGPPLEWPDPFRGITPRLCTLDCDFYIPLSSPIFRGLTKLHLSCIEYPEPDPIHHLLGILGLCLLLESISFVDLIFLATPIAHASDLSITLRYLQKLYIFQELGAQWVQSHFLPRIIVPASCILKITANVRHDDELRHLIPQRSNFLPSLPDIQSVRTLHIYYPRVDYNISVRGKMTAGDQNAFALTFLYPTEPNNPGDLDGCARIISSFRTSLPLPLLEQVAFSRGQRNDSDPIPSLESFFRAHPTLKTIALDGYWPWDRVLELFVAAPIRELCPLLQAMYLAPAQGLDEKMLLEAVKSRTAPAVDSSHLRGVTALQHLFFDPRCDYYEHPSASALSTLQNHVTVDFKECPMGG